MLTAPLHNLLHVAAVLGLLVQALLGPVGPGVALCISFHGCESPAAPALIDERSATCSGGCCATVRDPDASMDSTFVLAPSIGLRNPCGETCGDCLDLESTQRPTPLAGRALAVATPTLTTLRHEVAVVILPYVTGTATAAVALARPPDPAVPPRSACLHAPILRCVRILR